MISIPFLLRNDPCRTEQTPAKTCSGMSKSASVFLGYCQNPKTQNYDIEISRDGELSSEEVSSVEFLLNPMPNPESLGNAMDNQFDVTSEDMERITIQPSIVNSDAADSQSDKKTKRHISCPSCGKYFPRLCSLRSHYMTHQPLRPFSCSSCSQKFLRKHDLNRHKRIHMGIKSYSCRRCGKGFMRKDALRRHENMFPETQKFRCVAHKDSE